MSDEEAADAVEAVLLAAAWRGYQDADRLLTLPAAEVLRRLRAARECGDVWPFPSGPDEGGEDFPQEPRGGDVTAGREGGVAGEAADSLPYGLKEWTSEPEDGVVGKADGPLADDVAPLDPRRDVNPLL